MRIICENPREELDILCKRLTLLPDQALRVEEDHGNVGLGGDHGIHGDHGLGGLGVHLDKHELVEGEAGVVEDWVEPPIQVGRVTHFGSVTEHQIILQTLIFRPLSRTCTRRG